MKATVPNSEWYFGESRKLGLPFRCPFANVNSCPRYYSSLSLMGRAGCTKIEKNEDDRLLKEWKKSPLWPVTDETDTSLFGNPESLYYSNFCPEAMYDRFGIFVSDLGQYSDEYERDSAHQKLKREGVDRSDPSWLWSSFHPKHFSGCHLYSQLSHDWTRMMPQRNRLPDKPQPEHSDSSFDLFLSHASEDKLSFVRPLVSELRRYGLRVWYDETELEWGDRIRSGIDIGISHSRFGVVVLSRNFIQKAWPQTELDALFAREMEGGKVILPVRHGLTTQEVTSHFPTLAGKLSISSDEGVESIARKALDLVRPRA